MTQPIEDEVKKRTFDKFNNKSIRDLLTPEGPIVETKKENEYDSSFESEDYANDEDGNSKEQPAHKNKKNNERGGSIPSPQFNLNGDVNFNYETTDKRDKAPIETRFESQDLKLEHQVSTNTNPFDERARYDPRIPQTPHMNSNLCRSGSDYASLQQ